MSVISTTISLPAIHALARETVLPIRCHHSLAIDPSLPTIILLPFWGGSAATYQQVQEELSKLRPNCTSIAVSYPGTGAKSTDDSAAVVTAPSADEGKAEDHDIQTLASHVLGIIRHITSAATTENHLNIVSTRKIVLCAHSMSAKVAWEVLAALTVADDRRQNTISVTGLLLLAPAPIGPLVLPSEIAKQQLSAYDSTESATWTLQSVLTSGQLSHGQIQKLARDCVATSQAARRGWIELGMKRDCTPTVHSLIETAKDRLPTIVVQVGEHDRVETVGRVLAQTLDVLHGLGIAATFETVPDAGHLLPIEAVDAVVAAISGLIEK